MHTDFLRELRAELEHDRDELLSVLDGYPEGSDDPLVEMLRAGLNDLKSALRKMAEGGFGVCEQCGGSISEQRLRSVPASRICLTCETEGMEDPAPAEA